jgi:hypothetical protein
MAASKRTRPISAARNRARRSESAIENLFGRILPESLREAARLYGKQARKAETTNCPVEAAICRHLAVRLSTTVSSREELSQLFSEWRVLSSWLPISERLRKATRMERKGHHITFIRSHRLDRKNEEMLIQLATQRPGRTPEGREVAVRAMELHMSGQKWSEIEGQLLPHRLGVANPGRSINREVQFLKKELKRYAVVI